MAQETNIDTWDPAAKPVEAADTWDSAARPVAPMERAQQIVRDVYQELSPREQAAVRTVDVKSITEMTRATQTLVGGEMQRRFDEEQESAFQVWSKMHADVPMQQRVRARQLQIAKPEYSIDYIAKNLAQVEDEIKSENIPWSMLARDHPALAKYLQDPDSMSLALRDSASLTGIGRVVGGSVTKLKEDGTIDRELSLAPWLAAVKDSVIFNTAATLAESGEAIYKGLYKLSAPLSDLMSGMPGVLTDEEKKANLEDMAQRTARFRAVSAHAGDYRGFFDRDDAGLPEYLGRGVEWVFTSLGKNADLLLPSTALKVATGMRGLMAFNLAYSGLTTFSGAMEASDDPLISAAIAMAGAPLGARLMLASPQGMAIGANVNSIMRRMSARGVADALESKSFPYLARNLVARLGWDGFSGQLVSGALAGYSAATANLAANLTGKEPGEDVTSAFARGLTDIDMVPLTMLGTAHTLVADVGKLHRARAMAKNVESVRQMMLASKTAEVSQDVYEAQVKEMVAQAGGQPFFYLPLSRFNEVLVEKGLDPRSAAAQIHDDGGAIYDKAMRDGASHLEIPTEKLRRMFKSKYLDELAVNEGTFDLDVISRAEAAKITADLKKVLDEVAKTSPDKLPESDKSIYDAALAFAESDPAVAKDLYAKVKGFQSRYPEFSLQEVWDATWGPGGMWGPAGPKAKLSGVPEYAEMPKSTEALVRIAERESGHYASDKWAEAFKDEPGAVDFKVVEEQARATARERLSEALRTGKQEFFASDRKQAVGDAEVQIKEDLGQRFRNFYLTGEFWGLDRGASALGGLTDAANGKPLKIRAADVKALGLDPESFNAKMISKDPNAEMYLKLADVAEHFGIDGDADTRSRKLLVALRDALPEQEYKKAFVEKKLRETYGYDLLENPGLLMAHVMDAVQNEKVVPMVLKRYRVLAKKLDPLRQLRSEMSEETWSEFAERTARSKELRNLKPEFYARAGKRASERALTALEKGDRAAAFDATEQQLLNHYLYRAARVLEGSMGAKMAKLKTKAASDNNRKNLGYADPVYLDLHDSLLSAVGLGKQLVRPEALDGFLLKVEENFQLEDSAANTEGGWDADLVRSLLGGSKKWKDLTPGEADHVFRAIENIQHIAKRYRGEKKAERKAEVEELNKSAAEYMSRGGEKERKLTLQDRAQEPTGTARKVLGFFSLTPEELRSPRVLLGMLGPKVKEVVYSEFLTRRKYANDLLHEVYEPWKKTQEIFSKDKTLYEPLEGVEIDALRQKDRSGVIDRHYLLQVLKWVGSESGRDKAIGERGLNVPIEVVLRAVGRYLTVEQVDAVQAEHQVFDEKLLPLKSAEFQRRKGLPFREVKPLGYEIAFADGRVKTFKGGYYPVNWDRRPGVSKDATPVKMEERVTLFPSVPDGSFKPRTQYHGVPDFGWDNIPAHILADIHSIAFGEFVQNANHVLLNPQMTKNIREYLGPAYAGAPREWLERVAKEASSSLVEALRPYYDVMMLGRGMLSTSALGLNMPLFLGDMAHPFATAAMRDGIAMSVTRAGPALLRVIESATAGVATGHDALHEMIIAKSPDVVGVRQDALAEDMHRWFRGHKEYSRQQPGFFASAFKARDSFNNVAFWHLRQSDRVITDAIWLPKYERMLELGYREEVAIKEANEQVLASMPEYNVMMQAKALTHSNPFAVLGMVFQSYWMKLLEMTDEQLLMAGREKGLTRAVRSAQWAGRTMAMLTFGVAGGDFLQGRGPQEDEDLYTWALRKELSAPAKLFPYISMFTDPKIDAWVRGDRRERDIRFTNVMYAPFERLVGAVAKAMDGRVSGDEKAAALVSAALTLGGMPANAPTRAALYNYKVATGEEAPRGAFDWASGTMFGRRYGRSSKFNVATPLTVLQDIEEE